MSKNKCRAEKSLVTLTLMAFLHWESQRCEPYFPFSYTYFLTRRKGQENCLRLIRGCKEEIASKRLPWTFQTRVILQQWKTASFGASWESNFFQNGASAVLLHQRNPKLSYLGNTELSRAIFSKLRCLTQGKPLRHPRFWPVGVKARLLTIYSINDILTVLSRGPMTPPVANVTEASHDE